MRPATLLTWLALATTSCLVPPDVAWDNPLDDRDEDGVLAEFDCDDGNPQVGRQACLRCPDGIHTGVACDRCANPKKMGANCEQCVDPTKAGDDCDMIVLQGGTFQMGSDVGGSDEKPVHSVTLSGFSLDLTEVTVAAYGKCVTSGGCTAPNSGGSCNWGNDARQAHPINCLDWNQAKAYCTWLGKRLPTEAEWEYAARSGGQAITYPWGNALPSCNLAVMANGCGSGSTLAVCAKTPGNTAHGICDMAGNVWEWVEDAYGPYPGTPATNPVVNTGSTRVLRGGSWNYNFSNYLRAALRYHNAPSNRYYYAGFRCARTL